MIENRFTTNKYVGIETGFQFDGTDDYIEYSEPVAWESTNWAISCFSKLISDDGIPGNPVPVYSSNVFPTNNLKFRMSYRLDDQTIGIRLFPANVESSIVTRSAPCITTQWVHTIVQYDFNAKLVYFYVNTELVATFSLTWALTVISGYSFFIGYSPSNYGNVEIANLSVFNRLLDLNEIKYIHRYFGIHPTSTHNSIALSTPLQYKNIAKRSYFTSLDAATPVAVAQIGHTLSVGDVIRYSGTWVLADGTVEMNFSNPPTIVTAVTDADNFEYSQVGSATLSTTSFGEIGDLLYCQSDGSLNITPTDNFIGRITSSTSLLVADEIILGVTATNRQYNYSKTTGDAFDTVGRIYGKSEADLGITTVMPDTNSSTYVNLQGGTATIDSDLKSGFSPIAQAIKLVSTDAGFATNTYIDLNKDNLPNENTDSYTFFWLGSINYKPIPGAVANIREHMFLLSDQSSGFWNTSNRINFGVAYKDTAPGVYPRIFGNRSFLSSFTYNIDDSNTKLMFDQLMSWALTYNVLTGYWTIYFNGHEVATGNTQLKVDFGAGSIFRLNNTTYPTGTAQMYSSHNTCSFGYWKRALEPSELLQLHNNSVGNNPWELFPTSYIKYMQQDMVIWHNFNSDSFYDDMGTLKVINHADLSGLTDGVLVGFADLNEVLDNVHQIAFLK